MYSPLTVEDKVFMLLWQELFESKYGFYEWSGRDGWWIHDEARRCFATDYAKACVKESIKDPCYWWSIEIFDSFFEDLGGIPTSSLIDSEGLIYGPGNDFVTWYEGASVRPAIRISKNSTLWTYAGTVSSKEMKDYPVASFRSV